MLKVSFRTILAGMERNACILSVTNSYCPQTKKFFYSKPSNGCTGSSCPISFSKSSVPVKHQSLESIVRRLYSKKAERKEKRMEESESDSDSDNDVDTRCKGVERTNFWRRKMRTLHNILDVNKDGLISFNDFQLFTERFCSLGHLDADQAEQFNAIMKLTWEEQWGQIDPYNFVTVESYLEDMHHVLNDKSLKRRAHKWLPYLFKAVDKDKSGFISVHEFKLFFECFGLSNEHAAVSFAVIDTNGDGKISMKEFVKLGKEYFFEEDERKVSRMLWGPLIEH